MLYYAPAGAPIEELNTWIPLGAADDCSVHYDEDPLTDALLSWDLHGHCVSFTMPAGQFNPLGYWLLFRRRHPRVSAMHRAYRRRRR